MDQGWQLSQFPKANAPGRLDIHTNSFTGWEIAHLNTRKGSSLRNSPHNAGCVVPCLLWLPGLPWLHLDLGSPARAEVEGTLREPRYASPCNPSTLCTQRRLVLPHLDQSFAPNGPFGAQSKYMQDLVSTPGEIQNFWVHSHQTISATAPHANPTPSIQLHRPDARMMTSTLPSSLCPLTHIKAFLLLLPPPQSRK